MAEFDNLCMNCMADIGTNTKCPYCGCPRNKRQAKNAMPLRSVLNGRYIVGRVKKISGEGLTYIAYDTQQDVPIELHEFFPQSLSYRLENTSDIRIIGGNEVLFNEYITKFIKDSKKLNKLQEIKSIARLYDVFEENHTAYAVFEWTEHVTLRYFVEHSGGKLSWTSVRRIFMPVLSALGILHAHEIRHLGISPDTLVVTGDGKMLLSDFAIDAIRCVNTPLTPDLVSGCAAIEQYVTDSKLNESTDVYGFAASMFFALIGKLPQDSKKRRVNSRLSISNSILRGLPKNVVTALANALQVSPENRTQTFDRLKAELQDEKEVMSVNSDKFKNDEKNISKNKKGKKEIPSFIWVLSSCLVMLAVFTVIGFFWATHYKSGTDGQKQVTEAVASSTQASSGASAESPSSLSSNLILAPDLVGQNYDKLVSSSSNISKDGEYQILLSSKQFSDTMPENCIISQDPEPNAEMSKGTAIVVVVSEGAAVRTLPEIKGKTLSQASALITSGGFIPTKEEAYSDTVPKGTVIGYKDVKEGDEKAYGSSVVIVVSKGPAPSDSDS